MRRRRCNPPAALLLRAVAVLLLLPAAVHAQAEPAGALELAMPFGARAVGMGKAVVADRSGIDAVWWNPAGIAELPRRELALQYRQQGEFYRIVGVTYALPRAPIGTFAVSASMVDYGSESALDRDNVETGTFAHRFVVGTATFGTTIGRRVTAGVNFRVFQNRFDCSGDCGAALQSSSGIAPAVDAGVQFQPSDSVPLRFGLSIRHLGPRFQQNDAPQSDPLPSRIHLGASYERPLGGPASDPALRETRVRMSLEAVHLPVLEETALNAGAELSVQQRFFVRAGYTNEAGSSGASIGVGIVSGRLQIDLARLTGASLEAIGGSPTLLTLRLGL